MKQASPVLVLMETLHMELEVSARKKA